VYINTVIGTLVVDGWAVSLLHLVQQWGAVPSRCTICNGLPNLRPVYQLHIIRCGTIITRVH